MSVRFLAVSLVAAALLGCGPAEDVRTYTVPKPVEVPQEELTGDYQILGAMFPDDQPAWFFKFAGKADVLAPYAADFGKMMASVRFPKGPTERPTWDTPAGWTVGEGRGDIVLATVKPDPKKPELEVTFTTSRGTPLSNLARWAGQLGQDKFNAGHLPAVTKPLTGGLFVNLRGPKPPAAGPMMMGKPHP